MIEMKKAIINLILILLIICSFGFAQDVDEGLVLVTSNDGVIVEDDSSSDIFSFIQSKECLRLEQYRADYKAGVRESGTVLRTYGKQCNVNERIELVSCYYPGNVNGNTCFELFGDDWLKTSDSDRLNLNTACDGGDCYSQSWYLEAIENRYIGYNCVLCDDEQNGCLFDSPLYVCNPLNVNPSDSVTTFIVDDSLDCPDSNDVCWIPQISQSVCDRLNKNNCRQVSGGICTADDLFLCTSGFTYVAENSYGNDELYCVINGQIENPSFTTCSNGCKNGECEQQICIPQGESCDGNKVKECSSDGKNFNTIDTCVSGEKCVEVSFSKAECQQEVITYKLQCSGSYNCIRSDTGTYTNVEQCQTDMAIKNDEINKQGIVCEDNTNPCGDGKCTSGESYDNCRIDCKDKIIDIDGLSTGQWIAIIAGSLIALLIIIVIIVFFVMEK